MLAGVCSAGFSTTQLPGGERRRQLPCRHQDGKVPGNDLAHHAERLVEMVGNRIVVDLRDRAFLGANATGKVAPMIDGQGKIGGRGFADWLSVVPGLGQRQQIEVVFHALGNLVEEVRAVRGAGVPPALACRMGGVQRQLDVLRVGARNLAEGSSR